jgi:hypothetical protein
MRELNPDLGPNENAVQLALNGIKHSARKRCFPQKR